MRYKARERNRRQRGTATVEMAIVLTLLMMVTVGTIEYGWMFVNLQRITNAARQGARVQAVSGAPDGAGLNTINTLLDTMPDTPSVVSSINAAGESIVTATVVVDTSAIGLVNCSLIPMPAQLQAVVTMAKEP